MNKVTIQSIKDLENLRKEEFIINLESLTFDERKLVMYFLAGLTFNGGVLKKCKSNLFYVKTRV